MRDFIVALLVAFVLFRTLRVFFFGNQSKTMNAPGRNRQGTQQPPKPEGTITIEKPANQKEKKVNDDEGDYVDYEEVK